MASLDQIIQQQRDAFIVKLNQAELNYQYHKNSPSCFLIYTMRMKQAVDYLSPAEVEKARATYEELTKQRVR